MKELENNSYAECKRLKIPYVRITRRVKTFDILFDYITSDRDIGDRQQQLLDVYNKELLGELRKLTNRNIHCFRSGCSLEYLNLPTSNEDAILKDLNTILTSEENKLQFVSLLKNGDIL